jgi:hypothetical protein
MTPNSSIWLMAFVSNRIEPFGTVKWHRRRGLMRRPRPAQDPDLTCVLMAFEDSLCPGLSSQKPMDLNTFCAISSDRMRELATCGRPFEVRQGKPAGHSTVDACDWSPRPGARPRRVTTWRRPWPCLIRLRDPLQRCAAELLRPGGRRARRTRVHAGRAGLCARNRCRHLQ